MKFAFDAIPEGVKLSRGEGNQIAILFSGEFFKEREAPLKFQDAVEEGAVGIDACFSVKVDESEEEVADFLFEMTWVEGMVEGLFHLGEFLVQFIEDIVWGFPIETDICGVTGDGERVLSDGLI